MQEEGTYDGVFPEEYPEAYEGILKLRCFKINTAINSFYTGINRPYNLCQDCFYSTTFYQQELFEEIVDWHLSAPNEERIFDCSKCRIILIIKRPIIECGKCTDRLLK